VRRLRAAASRENLRRAARGAAPAVAYTARLVVTAVAAFLLAQRLLPVPAPMLAPLTSMLVVQVSLYRTLRSAGRRIVSVTAGVLVAVAVTDLVGFTWWSLGLTIAVALTVGQLLRLGDNLLEAPISAMLILQVGSDTAALTRVEETLIGAAVGLLSVLVASPVRVRPAQEAIEEVGRSMQQLLERMADGLEAEPDRRTTEQWLGWARRMAQQIRQIDQALAEAQESVRLNPRSRVGVTPGPSPALHAALHHLEHSALSIRGVARSMADRTELRLKDRTGLGAYMWEADMRERLAATLRALAAATRIYTRAVTTVSADEAVRLTAELEGRLSQARRHRNELGRVLRRDPGHWPLHGELLVHLDRLIDELRAAGRGPVTHRPGRRRRPITRGVRRVTGRIPVIPRKVAQWRWSEPAERSGK